MPPGRLLHLNKYFPSPHGSFKVTALWDRATIVVAAAGVGDGSVSAKNMSDVRRLNTQLISSPAGLFSGEQRVSRVPDFQIQFILVMERMRFSGECPLVVFWGGLKGKHFHKEEGGQLTWLLFLITAQKARIAMIHRGCPLAGSGDVPGF